MDASDRGTLDGAGAAWPEELTTLSDGGWFGEPAANGWPVCDPLPADWQFKTLLQASDYGADAKFVALEGQNALVHVAAGDLVLTLAPGEKAVQRTPLPSGYTGVAVTGRFGASNALYVLACVGADGACSLLRADAPGQSMMELSGSTLPSGFGARGMSAREGELCVFGTGLLCWRDQAWVEEIVTSAKTGDIVGLAFGDFSLAISEFGGVWVRSGSTIPARFQRAPDTSSAPLQGVTVSGSAAYVTGHYSVWAWVDGALGRVRTGFISAAWLGFEGREAGLLTAQGQLLHRPLSGTTPPWCVGQHVDLMSEYVRASSSSPCGLVSNFRFMTAQRVVGQNVCVLD